MMMMMMMMMMMLRRLWLTCDVSLRLAIGNSLVHICHKNRGVGT